MLLECTAGEVADCKSGLPISWGENPRTDGTRTPSPCTMGPVEWLTWPGHMHYGWPGCLTWLTRRRRFTSSQRKNPRSCLDARGRGNVPRLDLKFVVRQHMSFARLCWTMVYYWDNDVALQYHSGFPPRFWTIWFPDYLPYWSIE